MWPLMHRFSSSGDFSPSASSRFFSLFIFSCYNRIVSSHYFVTVYVSGTLALSNCSLLLLFAAGCTWGRTRIYLDLPRCAARPSPRRLLFRRDLIYVHARVNVCFCALDRKVKSRIFIVARHKKTHKETRDILFFRAQTSAFAVGRKLDHQTSQFNEGSRSQYLKLKFYFASMT